MCVSVWVDHKLDVTDNSCNLINWHILESISNILVSGFHYVHNKLLHYLLGMLVYLVLLLYNVVDYLLNSCNVSWLLNFFKHLLSLRKHLLLHLAHAFLILSLLLSDFLLSANFFLLTALTTPLGSPIIHVKYKTNLLLSNEWCYPFMVVSASYYNL